MDRYFTVSEARQRFLKLVDETLEGDQIIVTKHGKPAVAIVDFERLQTMKWVAELWQSPEAMRAMRQGLADAKAGRGLRVKGRIPKARELLKLARARGLIRG